LSLSLSSREPSATSFPELVEGSAAQQLQQRVGRLELGRWPVQGRSTNLAPGIGAAYARATSTSTMRSASPATTRVGTVMERGEHARRAGEELMDAVLRESFGALTPQQVDQLHELLTLTAKGNVP
jgi:hypothetical protein